MVPVMFFNVVKKSTFMLLMSLMFFSMNSFSANLKVIQEDIRRLLYVEEQTLDLMAIVEVDAFRQSAINKVISIMSVYNKKFSEEDKYAIANVIYEMSIRYNNLDVNLICATITHESARTWRPNVVSPAGALGLMQLMPRTGKFLSKHESIEWTNARQVLFDPVRNIRMGCRYLSMLIEVYHIDGGLAAYNGGSDRAERWLASGRNDEVLFEETRGYIPAILKLYDTYKN
ncbi:MAG: lytic transglycosylase domain-containing protein [Caldithrix sp.]|nr:MAG: lytic transglycosylase domain-containing protein [Caldithrix sp.]